MAEGLGSSGTGGERDWADPPEKMRRRLERRW